MKKADLISLVAIIVSCVGLALQDVTGTPVHIAISVIALVVMVVATVKGKKDFKVPALEIGYRAAYFVALLTGAVMVIKDLEGAVTIAHKAFAAIFAVLYVVNFVSKAK